MSDVSYEYIQFLNDKILEFLPGKYVRVGNKIHTRCPICGDSRKSSTKARGWIYLQNSSFYCFNCGTGMSGLNFLKYISGNSYEDIKREYVKLFIKSGMHSSLSSSSFEKPNDEPSLFELKPIVKPEWKNRLSDKATQYLKNRKVLQAPFLKDDLYSCYAKKNNDEYILIPWKTNGIESYYQLNDFQKLHSLKYIFPKDKKKLIAGLDNIDMSWKNIIVFEGFYDSLFVKNGVCVGTKAITDYQVDLIRERYPDHQICISFDNDEAGIESMCKLVRKNNDFKYFKWFNKNTEQKDINDYILAKNDVNIFTDTKILDRLIVDKLMMKIWLIQNSLWIK